MAYVRPLDEQQTQLGARLARARVRAGLTQVEAAKQLGFSQSRLAKLETGRRRLGFLEATRLAQLYSASLDSLAADSAADGS